MTGLGMEEGIGAIGSLFGWLGRRSTLFALIVAALVAYRQLRPSFDDHAEQRAKVERLEKGAAALPGFIGDAIRRGDEAVARRQDQTRTGLDAALLDARRRRDRLRADCSSDLAALGGGADAVIENRKRCVTAALLDREIATIAILRETLDARRPGETLPQAVRRQAAIMRAAESTNARRRRAIEAIDARILGRWRFAAERRRLVAEADEAARAYRTARRNARTLIAARRRLDAGAARANATIGRLRGELNERIEVENNRLGENPVERVRGWADRVGLADAMRAAALLLVGIVAAPYLIRTFLYFVLAPAAARRPAIRLRTPGGAAAIPPAEHSTTSVGVTLAPGEELLVRQDYLQASAQGGSKRTRWLLDRRHPLSSVAAGLTFLTRIRGEGELVTISAVRDPFAEVTVLTLSEGASCVLQPRALAAAAQPIGRPMRVTSHWRLGSLNAWLTLQLRYLVFHGPARLVVKGGRGVRVEPATRGRIFGQDQLVGFSAGLAYAVTRTETFWPYFFGGVSLLKDRVADGDGVLIVEEAPLAGRRSGARRGLEGAMDALLKVVGV